MATISKRGNSYRIKVTLGYDKNGKQIIKSTTFAPPKGTSEKKAEKMAQEYAGSRRTAGCLRGNLCKLDAHKVKHL